jgi:TetR/AcrR family transcriptional repressor of nem operon
MMAKGSQVQSKERPSARKARGAATRNRIVACATDLIYEKGYSRTTVDEVIQRAGVTKGSFYHHFLSKEELGCAVIENASSYILKSLSRPLNQPHLSPLERIDKVLRQIQSLVEEADCSRGCIIGNLALEMSHDHEDFRVLLAEAFKSWSSLIAGQLEEMKAGGCMPEDFDCTAFADFSISAIEGAIMMSKVTRNPAPMLNSIDMVLESLERAQSQ